MQSMLIEFRIVNAEEKTRSMRVLLYCCYKMNGRRDTENHVTRPNKNIFYRAGTAVKNPRHTLKSTRNCSDLIVCSTLTPTEM